LVEDDYLPLSALQHYAYCPRQCALIHLEQAWIENFWTAEGRLLHERVDSGETEQRGVVRKERSVSVISHTLKLVGKLDLLEIRGTSSSRCYLPVEYKRGKPKVEDWDKVQLCGQALCLEEMWTIQIKEGALWYWQTRAREIVQFDEKLRAHTKQIIAEATAMLASQKTPAAVYNKKLCSACSLLEYCEPEVMTRDHSKIYTNELFNT
jgi:CRISPR-associated exonuclease Cas4